MFNGNKIYKLNKKGEKKRVFFVKGLRIKFVGENAEIILPYNFKARCSRVILGNNCRFELKGLRQKLDNFSLHAMADNSECIIGTNFLSTSTLTILLNAEPDLKVTIGDDCMFGTNVEIRTSDAHTIKNSQGETINYGGNVIIGNHCWLGKNVTILKNTKLADGTIIGTKSLVTKDCLTPNSIYAGSPAKLIKTDVTWEYNPPQKEVL